MKKSVQTKLIDLVSSAVAEITNQVCSNQNCPNFGAKSNNNVLLIGTSVSINTSIKNTVECCPEFKNIVENKIIALKEQIDNLV